MPDQQTYRCVGKGNCGSVWAADDLNGASKWALKREDGGPARSIRNDSEMHQRIEHSLQQAQAQYPDRFVRTSIPRHSKLIVSDDTTWWSEHQHSFPSTFEPCNTLESERIQPFERQAREQIIDKYCHTNSRNSVKASKSDEDCIIRPYLGRRTHRPPSRFFTLRNKPLFLDQLIENGLPVTDYAMAMADTLAMLYWKAQVDARDVEFVLAPPRQGADAAGILHADMLGQHTVWLLDFDLVQEITLDENGIEMVARAFLLNDPYYPRPCSENAEDQALWSRFVERFLESSELFVGGTEAEQLLAMLIKRLEEMGRARENRVDGRKGESGDAEAGS